MASLDSSIKYMSGIGQVLAKRLARLSITTIRDVLYHFPHRYEAITGATSVQAITEPGMYTITGEILSITTRPTRRRNMSITQARICDAAGNTMNVIWFNQKYLRNQISVGTALTLTGKVERKGAVWQITNPQWQRATQSNNPPEDNALQPVYPLTEGITQRQIQTMVAQAKKYTEELIETIPEVILKKRKLMSLVDAINTIHKPKTAEALTQAQQRFAYEQIFVILKRVQGIRRAVQTDTALVISFDQKKIKAFVKKLSFTLTADQKKVAWRIFQDMEKTQPMNRMVQGDVGSGKTIVAFLAMYQSVMHNVHALLMAPTEVLAKQHFRSAQKFFNDFSIPILLLTSSTKKLWVNGQVVKIKKSEVNTVIEQYKRLMVIGTHSLIQDSVQLGTVGLAVIDEQHRFGVKQRAAIRQSMREQYGYAPHYLSLTATPIPRTLSLTLYGDLDVSIIRTKPAGRKEIITQVVTPDKRAACYSFMQEQIAAGQQVFVVCPLIEESDVIKARSVLEVYQELSDTIFPNIPIVYLHGKLTPQEKETIMHDFKMGKSKILVSTTVIEVGVDIPQATIMFIEGAHRFGLAQLHQLRGRVGRNDLQSYCFLGADGEQKENNRLTIMETVADGFTLAEYDLQFRGAGTMYGTVQSGRLPDQFNAFGNYELISQVQEDVAVLSDDYFESIGEIGLD